MLFIASGNLHSNPDTQNPHMKWACKYFLLLSAVKRIFFPPPLTSDVFTSSSTNNQLRHMWILSAYTMKTTFLVHWRVSNLTIQPCLLHCSSCSHETDSSYSFPAFTICIKSSHNLVVYWDILYKIYSLLGYPLQDFKFTGISSTRFQNYWDGVQDLKFTGISCTRFQVYLDGVQDLKLTGISCTRFKVYWDGVQDLKFTGTVYKI